MFLSLVELSCLLFPFPTSWCLMRTHEAQVQLLLMLADYCRQPMMENQLPATGEKQFWVRRFSFPNPPLVQNTSQFQLMPYLWIREQHVISHLNIPANPISVAQSREEMFTESEDPNLTTWSKSLCLLNIPQPTHLSSSLRFFSFLFSFYALLISHLVSNHSFEGNTCKVIIPGALWQYSLIRNHFQKEHHNRAL